MKVEITSIRGKKLLREFADDNMLVKYIEANNEKIAGIKILNEEELPQFQKAVDVVKPTISKGWATLPKKVLGSNETKKADSVLPDDGKKTFDTEFRYEPSEPTDKPKEEKDNSGVYLDGAKTDQPKVNQEPAEKEVKPEPQKEAEKEDKEEKKEVNGKKLNESVDLEINQDVLQELYDTITEALGDDFLSDYDETDYDSVVDAVDDFGREIDGYDSSNLNTRLAYAHALKEKWKNEHKNLKESVSSSQKLSKAYEEAYEIWNYAGSYEEELYQVCSDVANKYGVSADKLVKMIQKAENDSINEAAGDVSENLEDKLYWLYTHNKNYNKEQYYIIQDLYNLVKGKEKIDTEELENKLYLLQHHNKNYNKEQYYIIRDINVSDFDNYIKKLDESSKESFTSPLADTDKEVEADAENKPSPEFIKQLEKNGKLKGDGTDKLEEKTQMKEGAGDSITDDKGNRHYLIDERHLFNELKRDTDIQDSYVKYCLKANPEDFDTDFYDNLENDDDFIMSLVSKLKEYCNNDKFVASHKDPNAVKIGFEYYYLDKIEEDWKNYCKNKGLKGNGTDVLEETPKKLNYQMDIDIWYRNTGAYGTPVSAEVYSEEEGPWKICKNTLFCDPGSTNEELEQYILDRCEKEARKYVDNVPLKVNITRFYRGNKRDEETFMLNEAKLPQDSYKAYSGEYDDLIGKTIRINYTREEPGYTGAEGVVELIDSNGQLHGTWGELAVQPENDSFEIIK